MAKRSVHPGYASALSQTPRDLSSPAVLVVGEDRRIVVASDAAGALFGDDAAALTGRDVGSLIAADLNATPVGRVIRSSIERVDATPVPVELRLDASGNQQRLTVREVREDQLLLELCSTLDVAFDRTPLSAALFNTHGEYIRVNDNLCRFLGRTSEELLGRRDQEFTHPDDRAADLAAASRILRGELDTWQTEKRFVKPDGGIVWAIANLTFLRDEQGGALGWLGQFQDVTDRHEIEEQLRERERQLAEAQHVARVGSFVWHVDADTLDWSDELCRLFGREPGRPPVGYSGYLACVHPDDRSRVHETIEAARLCAKSFALEHRAVRADGSERVLYCRGKVESDERGRTTRVLGIAQDVTEARRVEQALFESERVLRAGFDGAMIGMALATPDGHCVRVNPAFCGITGYTEDQLLSNRFQQITHPDDIAAGDELTAKTLAGEIAGYEVEKRYLHANGGVVWAHLSISLVRNARGEPLYFVSQVQDIGERRGYEAELKRLAAQDPLTGLLNQRVFREELRAEISRARRHNTGLSIVLLDLDHFKQINDHHGHLAGDRVLTEVAKRLSGLVREGEHVGRVGGEEFAWILPYADQAGAFLAAERARNAIGAVPFHAVGSLTMSAGVCEWDDMSDADQLYARADMALYWAKHHGRNRTIAYSSDQARQLTSRVPTSSLVPDEGLGAAVAQASATSVS